MTKMYLFIIFLSFIDNLRFVTLDSSMKKVAKVFEKVAKTIIEWEI